MRPTQRPSVRRSQEPIPRNIFCKIRSEVERVAAATSSTRNDSLNKAAFNLGRLVIPGSEIINSLRPAALQAELRMLPHRGERQTYHVADSRTLVTAYLNYSLGSTSPFKALAAETQRTRRNILFEPKSPLPGNGIFRPETNGPKGAGAQGAAIGRQNLLAEPRRLGLIAGFGEISVRTRMRGGPGRLNLQPSGYAPVVCYCPANYNKSQ